jgi:putative transposase
MSQSLSQIYLHIVFSTKERKPFLQELASRQAMHKCLANTSNELGCPCLEVGGVEDHVHILSRKESYQDEFRGRCYRVTCRP